MMRFFTNRAAAKTRAAKARGAVELEAEERVSDRAVADAFMAFLRALDEHAAERDELGEAGVAQRRIDELYPSAFSVALTKLVPLVQKENLLRLLISNANRAHLLGVGDSLLREAIDLPGYWTSEWRIKHPEPGLDGDFTAQEKAIDAMLGPAYGSHNIGNWVTAALWNAWWLAELRGQMSQAQRAAAEAEISWVARNLVPDFQQHLGRN